MHLGFSWLWRKYCLTLYTVTFLWISLLVCINILLMGCSYGLLHAKQYFGVSPKSYLTTFSYIYWYSCKAYAELNSTFLWLRKWLYRKLPICILVLHHFETLSFINCKISSAILTYICALWKSMHMSCTMVYLHIVLPDII